MLNKSINWHDQEIYYAVIDTPQGGIWRLFSFDCELTKEEMIEQIIEFFPGALAVRSLDNWGTAYSLAPSLGTDKSLPLQAIRNQFDLIQQTTNDHKAVMYRDLLNEMELTFEASLFPAFGEAHDSAELRLYNELKLARDAAFLFESTRSY